MVILMALVCSSGYSLPPATLWPMTSDGYDSDDEQYRDVQLDLQRRTSIGEILRERLGRKQTVW